MSSHRIRRPGRVFAFGHGSTLHVWEVRPAAVLLALYRVLRPRRAWSRVLGGLAVFAVVMAIIGAIAGPPAPHATGKIANVSPVSPAPPRPVVTTGQGEVQTTSADLARTLGQAFGAEGDVYLVPRLDWSTPGMTVRWVWPAGCDRTDMIACQAVGLTYNR